LHNGCTEISWPPPPPPTRAVTAHNNKALLLPSKKSVESSLSQKIPGNEEVMCYNPTPPKRKFALVEKLS